MSLGFKTITLAATLFGLLVATNADAGFRDYNSKPWAQLQRRVAARSQMRYTRTYRSTAPVASADESVAQAPTEERRFSYSPSEESASGHCHCGAATESAPETAKAPTETTRRYSYEPSTTSAPRYYSSRRSQTPRYLLQKTDPHKYLVP